MGFTDWPNASRTAVRCLASWTFAAVITLTVASVSYGSQMPTPRVAVTRSETSAGRMVRLFDLAAVRRSFDAFARRRATMGEGERAAAWDEFCQLAEAVVGSSSDSPWTFDELIGVARDARGPEVVATPGVATRNRLAYDMQAMGYSTRETADVVGRRISLRALVTAHRMIAIGQSARAADYLERRYERVAALQDRTGVRSGRKKRALPEPFDTLIRRHARAHNVDPAVVHAIIATESSFDPGARSRAGAIGLMQLMPMTAQELEVDPYVPAQNIEGGVRYLSQLLEQFGRLDLALVAYNAGPGFAERYIRGRAMLYDETREYVTRVMAALKNEY